jgi:hypothetical protein
MPQAHNTLAFYRLWFFFFFWFWFCGVFVCTDYMNENIFKTIVLFCFLGGGVYVNPYHHVIYANRKKPRTILYTRACCSHL